MDSPEIYELTQTRNELKEAKQILERILYADERGEYIGFNDAMREGATFLKRMEELHG